MNPTNAVDLLISQKWSEKRIADEVGTSQPTINRIKRGSATTYELGAKLISLALTVAASAGEPVQTTARETV